MRTGQTEDVLETNKPNHPERMQVHPSQMDSSEAHIDSPLLNTPNPLTDNDKPTPIQAPNQLSSTADGNTPDLSSITRKKDLHENDQANNLAPVHVGANEMDFDSKEAHTPNTSTTNPLLGNHNPISPTLDDIQTSTSSPDTPKRLATLQNNEFLQDS